MRRWHAAGYGSVVALIATCGAMTALGQGEQPATARALTTADGRPNLAGVWNAGTVTPLERPAQFEGKLTVSEREAMAFARTFLESSSLDNIERDKNPTTGVQTVGGYNEFWVDRGSQMTRVAGEYRTSLIVDPADGRMPATTKEGQERDARNGGLPSRPDIVERRGSDERPGDYDNPEQRPLAERCLMGFGSTSGPPALPTLYNNFKQIIQTADQIMLVNEMVHDVRIIRIGGRHLPPEMTLWMGDSIGRWEGDTLVVDTTNFNDKTRFRGSSPKLHVVERFSRTGPDSLLYQFTVEDPTTWESRWSGEYTWNATDERVYEYACHEGNYALPGVLAGARLLEKESN